MQKNTSITLGDHFDGLIAGMIRQGRFNSVSEAVRAGLRLLEEHEQKVVALRLALEEGEKSGEATAFSMKEILEEARQEEGLK
ncbi:MAG: type II toxin-antitoxin system ParD family antitoxin [Gammaproteobacteria bacterium]|nr:type II toxin-antitoxin system ParD family antitoxin [Gammaproteobacteria bacterium]